MAGKKSDLGKDGYTAKQGGHGRGHKLGPGDRGTSIIASKQRAGKQTGTRRPGFPHLPPEGGPRESDRWRG